jgi:hypothetical protein
MQGKAPKEIHAILIETSGEHAPSYATVKNWVAQFKLFKLCTVMPEDVRGRKKHVACNVGFNKSVVFHGNI